MVLCKQQVSSFAQMELHTQKRVSTAHATGAVGACLPLLWPASKQAMAWCWAMARGLLTPVLESTFILSWSTRKSQLQSTNV